MLFGQIWNSLFSLYFKITAIVKFIYFLKHPKWLFKISFNILHQIKYYGVFVELTLKKTAGHFRFCYFEDVTHFMKRQFWSTVTFVSLTRSSLYVSSQMSKLGSSQWFSDGLPILICCSLSNTSDWLKILIKTHSQNIGALEWISFIIVLWNCYNLFLLLFSDVSCLRCQSTNCPNQNWRFEMSPLKYLLPSISLFSTIEKLLHNLSAKKFSNQTIY